MGACTVECQNIDVSGMISEPFEPFDGALFTDERDAGGYVWTSLLLTGLLVGGVPATATVSEVPTAILVVVAGLCYLAAVLLTGRAFEGLASAVFILGLFDIAITLVDGPGIATVDVVAVDVVAIPLLSILLYEALAGGMSPRLNGRTLAVVGFVGFVCWAFAASVFGSGPSRAAGMMFAIEQLRYLVLFVVAALVVRRENAWCAIYPLVIAAVGNLYVSLAQIANGGRLGLTFLGEPPDRFLGSFVFGPVEIATGFHAGGFVGHGRELVMVLFIALPLLIVVSLRGSWLRVPVAGVTVAASILSIRVADTDAGWATLVVLGVLFGTYLLCALLVVVRRRYSTVSLVPVLGLVVAFGYVLVRGARAVLGASEGRVPLLRTNTLEVRIEEYVAAVRIALENPLFGLGGKNFYLLSESYGLPADLGVHNTFLSHLAATGFVGLSFYALAVLAVLYLAFKLAVRSAGKTRLLWVAVVCGMVTFHAYSSWMAAYHWTVGNSTFWLLSGVTVGAAGTRYRIGRR